MSFDIEISSPFPRDMGGSHFYGGPNSGGHVGPHWYIEFGMDLGAPAETEVHAAFDCHVTKLNTDKIDIIGGPVYGAEIFVRSMNDGMGAFYTHLRDLDAAVATGATMSRGQLLGHVAPATSAHVHLAIVEILSKEDYRGVDLYKDMQAISETDQVLTVTFSQDGSPPTVNGAPSDTGQGSNPTESAPGSSDPDLDLNSTIGVQKALSVLGFDPGPIDGISGDRTAAAVVAFQQSVGLDRDGEVGPRTRAAIAEALSGRES